MLEQILKNINNYFKKSSGVITEIQADGFISYDEFFLGQYVKIEGSILNDGVYRIKEKQGDKYITYEDLQVENNISYVYGLAIPREILRLSEQVENHVKGIKSETLGDYSVTYDDWKVAYKEELSRWRKVYP